MNEREGFHCVACLLSDEARRILISIVFPRARVDHLGATGSESLAFVFDKKT
jgi:hypothetical protein